MLINYLPPVLQEIEEFIQITNTHDIEIDKLYEAKIKLISNMYILEADAKVITRLEQFLDIAPNGTLEQRRAYIVSKLLLSDKLTEAKIKDVVRAITQGTADLTFFGADENCNPKKGFGFLEIIVKNPLDISLFADVERVLKPLLPAHIEIGISKYISTWQVINDSFNSWEDVAKLETWQDVADYVKITEFRKEIYNVTDDKL